MTEAEMDVKFEEGMELYRQGRYEAAHDIWLDLAKNGHVKSHYELAKLYLGKNMDAEDDSDSYMHVRFAIAGGWPDTEGIKDELDERLDDSRRERSARLRAEWIKQNPPQPYHNQDNQ